MLVRLLEWLLSLLTAPPQVVGAAPRSPQWPKVRAAHLKLHPECEACGCREQLSVHHKMPYHVRPDLELEPSNLITLCEKPSRNCHFVLGHLLDWSAYNPAIDTDAAVYRQKVIDRSY